MAESGIGFSYMVGLFENNFGNATSGDHAEDYADALGSPADIPVLADFEQALLLRTPYNGSPLPGKCVLSPTMELLDCFTGHGEDADALDFIRAHATQ